MTFPILDKPAPTPYGALNDEQKIAITDIFINTDNPIAVTESDLIAELDSGRYCPISTSKEAFEKQRAITDYCNSLMTGEETEPQTIEELKTKAKENFPECSRAPFENLIDKMVENSTVEGTFKAYKYFFDNREPIV